SRTQGKIAKKAGKMRLFARQAEMALENGREHGRFSNSDSGVPITTGFIRFERRRGGHLNCMRPIQILPWGPPWPYSTASNAAEIAEYQRIHSLRMGRSEGR
ncbi:MAG: hypothetical protein WA748_12520, partial [Candidatus Acidiferrum sp.]